MQKRHKVLRQRVISNRQFKKMWDKAGKYETEEAFCTAFTNPLSEDYFDFNKKYNMNPIEVFDMLKEIYNKRNMTFRRLIELTGKRKADISNIFCIPIRTIEAWYDGTNPCSPYVKLMILKHFYLLNLGKWVILESDKERVAIKPQVYSKSDVARLRNTNTLYKEYETEEDREFLETLNDIAGAAGGNQKESMIGVGTSGRSYSDMSYLDKFIKKEKKEKIKVESWADVKKLL